MRPESLGENQAAFEGRPDLGFSCGGFEVIDADGRNVPESVVEGPSLGDLTGFSRRETSLESWRRGTR